MTKAVTLHRSALARGFAPLAGIKHMLAVVNQRHALTKLDDTALNDIGLTREQAKREANRAPWDAPAHWRR